MEDNQSFMHTWSPLISVCLAMFIVVVDSTMMNVAISAIVEELNTSVSALQAAISLYSLVMASLMLTGGKLGDIHGVKRMFVIGVIIYGVGTLIAALSPNIEILTLGWSVIEGIAAALLIPLSMTLIIANYSGAKRALGFGILGGVQASASAVGPILGGVLTTYFSWRWGFALQVIIVVVILLQVRWLRESDKAQGQTMDWAGTVMSVVGLFLIVFGILLAGTYGWWNARRPFVIGDMQISPFGLSVSPFLIGFGVLVMILFFWWQQRREKLGKTPLVRLHLFKNTQFVSGFMTDAFQSLVLAGIMFIIPLFLQTALGYSAIQTGLALLPLSVSVFIIAMSTPGLGKKISPKYLVQLGVVLMGLGVFLLHQTVSMNLTSEELIIPLLVFGAGTGLMLAQITNITLSAVKSQESGEASGINNTVKELGSSLGVAIIGSVLFTLVISGLVNGIATAENIQLSEQEEEQISIELEDSFNSMTDEDAQGIVRELSPEEQQSLTTILDDSIVKAKQGALLSVGVFILFALIASFFLPKNSLPALEPSA